MDNANTQPQSELKELTPEEKEYQQGIEAFNRYPKLKKWAELFLDKNNKATYGNRTESAMQAYDCKNRVVAGQIGAQNFKKLRGLASAFADQEGFTFELLYRKAVNEVINSDNPAWFDRVLELLDYKDNKFVVASQVNNIQNNYNFNGEQTEDFSAKFKKFLESE